MTTSVLEPETVSLADSVEEPSSSDASADDSPKPVTRRWAGTIGMEGVQTGDGRLIDKGALTWETPFPLRFVDEDIGWHDGAVATGTCTLVERRDGGVIWGEGTFDLEGDDGYEAARMVANEVKTGVSMDLDDVVVEFRDADGNPIDADDGDLIIETIFDGTGIDAITSGRIRGLTIVDIPAFIEAHIHSVDDDVDDTNEADTDAATEADKNGPSSEKAQVIPAANADIEDVIEAASAPVAPPKDWFLDPKLPGPTPLTIGDDGHVYGHLATWGVCHTANPAGPGTCTTAPSSNTDYARFHVGSLKTKEGLVIGVGHITMGTGHAGPKMSPSAAASHYDNTGTCVADVRAGEDQFGIWVSGALRPDVTPEQIRVLRASPLSGDWRRVDGSLELMAALAVNVPGFPIPRPTALVASGETASLVASGMLAPRKVLRRSPSGAGLTSDDLQYLKRLAAKGRAEEKAETARRVHAFHEREKVRRFAAGRSL